ncbi:MAG: PBSX family phage terminase large subunit [Succinivibrio sp.]|nr:PBSX family phage terminase large subunit [Succinivibrio sp.]
MPDLKLSALVGGGYAGFWHSTARYRVVKGGRASKKSTTAALWFVVNLMSHPQANLLVVRRYGRTLKDSCFAQLRWAIDRLNASPYWRATTNPMELTFEPTGQKILFRGLDDGIKITSVTVPKGVLCWAWIDEAYEIREQDFNKLDMSLRGKMPKGLHPQLVLTFNPWSDRSWLKPRFFEAPSPHVFTLTTTYQQNEWLSDEDREIFEDMREHNPRRYAIEGEGHWGVSEGLIFERSKLEDFDAKEFIKRRLPVVYGMDFGFTDPNAFIGAIIDAKAARLYVFMEWSAVGVTNAEIAQAIKDKGVMHERVYCDSAEPKSIAELRRLGINAVAVSKGADSVRYGIQKLQGFEIIVHPECTGFWHSITNYVWKKDRNGQPTDVPEHEFSHFPDALRYAVSDFRTGGFRMDASNRAYLGI